MTWSESVKAMQRYSLTSVFAITL